ncbi:hypothetical protein GR7B_00046 [Vibrio phage vB_VcorM_GR7B]|nr:hypothetical protein GR7B_00046 [Vibrio phage vB_VcorM_GR7B]
MMNKRKVALAALIIMEIGLVVDIAVDASDVTVRDFTEFTVNQPTEYETLPQEPMVAAPQVAASTPTVLTPSELKREKEIACLSLGMYGESRDDTAQGIIAIGSSILNRTDDLRDSRVYKDDTCSVLLSRAQYESIKDDLRQLTKLIRDNDEFWATPIFDNPIDAAAWLEIKYFASGLYDGYIKRSTKSNHFWSPSAQYGLGRKAPDWEPYLKPLGKIGKHLHYTDRECVNDKCRYFTKQNPYRGK